MPEKTYQGRPIRKHSLAIRGASGDALNGALKVDPQDFTPGESAYVVLEIVPTTVKHDPMDDGDAWDLVQVTKAKRGAILSEADALVFLDAVSIRLEEIRVEETGQNAIGTVALEADHVAGLHRRKRNGCPICHPDVAPAGDEDVVTAPAGSDEAQAQRDELESRRVARAEKATKATTRKRAPRARKSTTKK